MRDLSPFLKLLTAYLSRNTLHTVCHWLNDLVSMTVNVDELLGAGEASAGGVVAGGEGPHSYRPPLPNITTRPLSTFIQVNNMFAQVTNTFS